MTSLLLFAGMTLAVCLAPGPNVMLVIGFALRQGFSPALRAIVGITSINLLYLVLAALGLVALVVASAPLFALLRYCGAAYLIYLGYKMLRAGLVVQTVEVVAPPLRSRPLLQGVITHLGNPKGVLYWSALLPQFLDTRIAAKYSLALQISALGALAIAIDFAVMCAYALIFASASQLFARTRFFRWIEIGAGLFFIVSGLLLGTERFETKLSDEINSIGWRVGHRNDIQFALAGGAVKNHIIVDAFAEQCACERRVHADFVLFQIEFVGADDAIDLFIAIFVFDRDPGAEEYLVAVAGKIFNDLQFVDALCQKTHAAVDFAQAAFAVNVIAVFRAVAVFRGFVDDGGHLRALDFPELMQLGAQGLHAFGRDIARTSALRGTITAHRFWVIQF